MVVYILDADGEIFRRHMDGDARKADEILNKFQIQLNLS